MEDLGVLAMWLRLQREKKKCQCWPGFSEQGAAHGTRGSPHPWDVLSSKSALPPQSLCRAVAIAPALASPWLQEPPEPKQFHLHPHISGEPEMHQAMHQGHH